MHPAMQIFQQLSRIPRESGNERQVSDWLRDYATQRGFETVQDQSLNILIRVPASPGAENAPTVILQGHMDMVCVKDSDSTHNFLTDPISLRYDGDFLRANGTTLGADDGFAIAYGLALLEDTTLAHPPLELLFTVDEEVSMKGALTFDAALLQGRLLINLDSEDEGVICAGSAGAASAFFHLPISRVPATLPHSFSLSLEGLAGGHSGMEIHRERANAIRQLCRVLDAISPETPLELLELSGGSKGNAIPVSARATVFVSDPDALRALVARWDKLLKQEYQSSDPDISLTAEPLPCSPDAVLDHASFTRLTTLISLTPCGPDMRDPIIDLVLNSNNLAVIKTAPREITIHNFLRSSVPSLLDKLLRQMELLCATTGAKMEATDPSPSWTYTPDSPLRELAAAIWKEISGHDAKIEAIHAGLEVGFFTGAHPDLDAISIGPSIRGAHTTKECMSLSSFERTYTYLQKILESLAR